MSLEINRLRKGAEDVSSSTNAEFRVMKTIDGTLVREGDPRGAFLAYAPGDAVAEHHVKEYRDLAGGDADDDRSFDERAIEHAKPDTVQRGARTTGIGDREATEMADRAREIANAPTPERVDVLAEANDKPVATARIYRSEDGTMSYEAGDDRVQVYAPGDAIADDHADAVKALGDAPESTPEQETPAAKGTEPAANKAVTRGRTSNK